jgi:diguanylate cyclase (GGDEF)-like protein
MRFFAYSAFLRGCSCSPLIEEQRKIMEGKSADRGDEHKSKTELLVELDVLRRRLAEMSDLEERRRQAEATLKLMEERSRLWRECAPMGVCAVDEQGRIAVINTKMREMLSVAPSDGPDGGTVSEGSDLLQSGIGEPVRLCLEKKEDVVFDQPLPGTNGECKFFRYHLSPVTDANGRALGAIAFGEDLTTLQCVEQAFRESEERYRILFQSAPIPMIERDASTLKSHIEQLRASGIKDFRDYIASNPREVAHCMSMIKTVSYNAAILNLMEISGEEALSNGFGMALFEDAQELAGEIVLMLALGGITNEKERTFTTHTGKRKNVLAKTLVLSGHEDTFNRIVVAMVDITERKQAEDALRVSEQRFRDQAMRDDLTGLYNRRYLYRTLDKLIEAGCAREPQVSVIFIDLDHFKDVVDTYGHLSGSQVIREVGAVIQSSVEPPGYAVAYAGDEFVVVLPGLDGARATQKALEIRHLIRSAVFLRDRGAEVRLRASFGIATCPDHAHDMRGLLAAADQALFAVKEEGKDSVRLYGTSDEP